MAQRRMIMDLQPHERIFLAVDTNDIAQARRWVEELKGKVGGFKIGLEMITNIIVELITTLDIVEGSEKLREVQALFMAIGEDLFWDGKFDDIPNTIAGASEALVPLNPKFFNVHASAGTAAMKEAVAKRGESKLLAVTLLTSFSGVECQHYFNEIPRVLVPQWATSAVAAGVDGLISSPVDLEYMNLHEELRAVPKMTPGIRPAFSQKGDQKRVMTPAEALRAGVTWMVIGRPITQYPDGPAAAVDRIVDEIAQVA